MRQLVVGLDSFRPPFLRSSWIAKTSTGTKSKGRLLEFSISVGGALGVSRMVLTEPACGRDDSNDDRAELRRRAPRVLGSRAAH